MREVSLLRAGVFWMKQNNLLASIIIPARNCAMWLRSALYGISQQTVPKHLYEVVVADDGSQDNLHEVINTYADVLNISVIMLPNPVKTIRLASSRNAAIIAAKGEIIVTLDADCIPTKKWLYLHISELTHEKVATIGPRKFLPPMNLKTSDINILFDSYGEVPDYPSIANYGQKIDRRLPELRKLKSHVMPFNCFHFCNTAFRKKDAIEVGLIDPTFDGNWGYEDIEFAYRLWQNGVTFRFLPNALVLHQENTLHTQDERRKGRATNYHVACQKIPGFQQFRENLGR